MSHLKQKPDTVLFYRIAQTNSPRRYGYTHAIRLEPSKINSAQARSFCGKATDIPNQISGWNYLDKETKINCAVCLFKLSLATKTEVINEWPILAEDFS